MKYFVIIAVIMTFGFWLSIFIQQKTLPYISSSSTDSTVSETQKVVNITVKPDPMEEINELGKRLRNGKTCLHK